MINHFRCVLSHLFCLTLIAFCCFSATGQKLIKAKEKPVKNSYIVVLKTDPTTIAPDLVKKNGGKFHKLFKDALFGFTFEGTEKQAQKIAADRRVSYVEEDRVFSIKQVQSNPVWNLDRIDQRAMPIDLLYHYSTTASSVNVYVLDTGIRITHQDFQGRADEVYSNVPNPPNSDCNGHGTHVAGTIASATYGVAKQAHVHSITVMACDGTGQIANLIDGVNWIVAHVRSMHQVVVANISSDAAGSSPSLETAITNSIANGVVYTISAGNGAYDACNFTPARVPQAITVGASDEYDNRALYSNLGACVDLYAPGNRIVSLSNADDTSTVEMSGSSMAAPHMAGITALYLATHTHAKVNQVIADVIANATPNALGNLQGDPHNLLAYSLFP